MEGSWSRPELMESYAHPYRRRLPAALAGYGVHYLLGLTVLAAVAAAVGAIAGAGFAGAALTIALLGVCATVAVSLWALAHGVLIIRERTQEWRPDRHDLADARAHRPQAADADPAVAHAEYVVAVSDAGDLVTFEFLPLGALEELADDAFLITGTPRYQVRPVGREPFDPDTWRASEQLVAAQERAAELERDAIARARRELEIDALDRELARESASTGEALRTITGQRRRRR